MSLDEDACNFMNILDRDELERRQLKLALEAVRYTEIRERNKVRIRTKVSKQSIMTRDYFPANDPVERKIFKYYCPICLRYFNTLLLSSCCDNYICRFCIGDMAKKAKTNPNFLIMCSHCTETNYRLTDVDPKAPLKIYTDTPQKATTNETVN